MMAIVKTSGGRTAPPTPSPVPEGSEDVDDLMTEIEPSSRSERGKLKHSCLQRDSYRCVLSGYLDESKGNDPAYSDVPDIDSTDCSHILPFALASFDPDKTAEVATALFLSFSRMFLLTYTMPRLRLSPRYGQPFIVTFLR